MRVVEAGRVELEELHVRDRARRRGTPSRRRRRSRRRGSTCRGRPCRRRRSRAPSRARRSVCTSLVVAVEHVGAPAGRAVRRAAAARAMQVDREVVLEDAMSGSRATAASSARLISRPVASAACTMRRCEWPPSRPRSYSRSSSGRPRRREVRAERDQLADPLRALAHDELDDVRGGRARRRRRACRRRALERCRPGSTPRRCRPARSGCCSRAGGPW